MLAAFLWRMLRLMESGGALVKTGATGAASAAAGLLRRIGGAAVDLLYPPVCLHCGTPIASADALCAACFARLRPITAPMCPRLGIPFEVSLGPGALSAEAIAEPPPFGRARAAVVYNEVARRLVSRLKYGDQPELARFLARLMAPAGAELWPERPILVPVPLHRLRHLRRRYNQSAELARAVGRLVGLPVDTSLVVRARATPRQVGLSAAARSRNVAGAFAVHPEALARLEGRGVVLIDDVVTTGATVNAVTRALNRAGIEKVDVLSFARVVIGAEEPI
jgi:ComF family protein